MPGAQSRRHKLGNLSQYLAQYILSALGTCAPTLREEDIGIDFQCTIAERIDSFTDTYGWPFSVQVKSDDDPLVYGEWNKAKKKKNRRWKMEEVTWLRSQEIPFFLGIVDRSKLTLDLFSTMAVTASRNYCYKPTQIVLAPNQPTKLKPDSVPLSAPLPGVGDGLSWTIPLGLPLVSMAMDQVADDKAIPLWRDILKQAIEVEQRNLAYSKLNYPFCCWLESIRTNNGASPFDQKVIFTEVRPGEHTDKLFESIGNAIAALLLDFSRRPNGQQGVEALKPLYRLVRPGLRTPEILPLLDKIVA